MQIPPPCGPWYKIKNSVAYGTFLGFLFSGPLNYRNRKTELIGVGWTPDLSMPQLVYIYRLLGYP